MIEGLKPYTYGYMYPDNTLRFSDREINGMRPLHPVPLYSLEQIDTLQKQLVSVTQERDDLQYTFDLQWEADQRAIKGWQEAHPGNDLVWPDRCCMVMWMMGRYAQALSRLRKATTALEEIYNKDTRVTDGGKCHDLGPCAEIATATLCAITDEKNDA